MNTGTYTTADRTVAVMVLVIIAVLLIFPIVGIPALTFWIAGALHAGTTIVWTLTVLAILFVSIPTTLKMGLALTAEWLKRRAKNQTKEA